MSLELKGLTFDECDRALNRLDELLVGNGISVTVTCCGGVVFMRHFRSRDTTQDIDAVFPDDHFDREALLECIRLVADEQGLEGGAAFDKNYWMNDAVSVMGLKTQSDVAIFKGKGISIFSASWEEMLSHKLCASRNAKDIEDAKRLLQEIGSNDKRALFVKLIDLKPFGVSVDNPTLSRRLDAVWNDVFGRDRANIAGALEG